MDKFEFNVEIECSLERARNAFWELEDWPRVAKHVRSIEMIYADENVQVLKMHVVTRNHSDTFKSVRYARGNVIHYFQPDPPPILDRHWGYWRFQESRRKVVVTSFHEVDVNVLASSEFLNSIGVKTSGEGNVREEIRRIIENNSLQTMNALKERLEKEEAHEYEKAARAKGFA